MTDGSATKALVQKWLAAGLASPEGLAMLADDFVWQGPRSMAEIFDGEGATQRGPEGLARLIYLDEALYSDHASAADNTNMHFMIAEDDVFVMEFDAKFTTHDGDPYHNYYCLVVRVADGKIAEVREHADTLYSHQVCMGTPEKHNGVLKRLSTLRSGGEV